jgi:hypothetical protein
MAGVVMVRCNAEIYNLKPLDCYNPIKNLFVRRYDGDCKRAT